MIMFQHNVNIKKMNSWGIASTVTYFAEPQDEYELQKILKGSPSIRCPNINKIRKLGFSQKITLKNGIKKVLK